VTATEISEAPENVKIKFSELLQYNTELLE
jgi:hypothetical protein